MTRSDLLTQFLRTAGWARAVRAPLAGDASGRRYERLLRPGGTGRAVLMDAPPDAGEDTGPFIRMAQHLLSLSLSAPRILASDAENGFLLLEDLGDALFARLIEVNPGREEALYLAAADLLLDLHRHAVPGDLPPLGPPEMAVAVDPALSWYAAGAGAKVAPGATGQLSALVLDALQKIPPCLPVLALRDFHAENLLWLPERDGVARVGLLDFQDAFAGHPAYDLVSLLEDARRDVSPAVREVTLAHYIRQSGSDVAAFRASCATVAAQRNLRILGVFTRLSMHFGKPHYVDLIPRVWGHLQGDLAAPELARLREFVAETLPPPTPETLERIKQTCGTRPTP